MEKKVELGNGFTVSSYKELFTSAGDLQLAGYYYMDKKVGINVETPDGSFYLNVNAGSGDLIAKINPVRQGTIRAIQLFALPGNTVCLVGEHQVVNSTPVPGKPLEYTYNYNNGNISLTKFALDGSQVWSYLFERDLRSVSDGGRSLSAYAWKNENDIKLLFADALSRHDDKKQFIEFGSTRVDVIQNISADGKFKSETFIKDPRIGGKRGEYMFIPATGDQYKEGKLFMLASRGLELVGATIGY